MKKLEATINTDSLIEILETIEAIRKDPEKTDQIIRSAGFLEGILHTTGKLIPKKPIPYKDISYLEVGWLGQKRIKTRKQTYIELMVEMTESLIEEVNSGAQYETTSKEKEYSKAEVLEQLNLLYSMKNSMVDTFTDDNDYITERWFEQFKER